MCGLWVNFVNCNGSVIDFVLLTVEFLIGCEVDCCVCVGVLIAG
jgi:hypothetical protein